MKAFKAFIKPFEAPRKSVKIKIQLNFFSSSGIGTGRPTLFNPFQVNVVIIPPENSMGMEIEPRSEVGYGTKFPRMDQAKFVKDSL